MARAFRNLGAIVAFDGNYRPRLWESVEEARLARDRAIACANIGLPTFEDEAALSGERSPPRFLVGERNSAAARSW